MCQKSCHGSKRMSQAFSVIKPTVAKCTGRQWRFVDDNFFFFVHQFGAATCFPLVPFFFPAAVAVISFTAGMALLLNTDKQVGLSHLEGHTWPVLERLVPD